MAEVVEGCWYLVRDRDGEADAGPYQAEETGLGFMVGSWFVEPDGRVASTTRFVVEVAAPAPEGAAPSESDAESTDATHAADLAFLAECEKAWPNRLEHFERRLRVRNVHALERITEALEVLAGTALEVAEAHAPEPDAEPSEDPVQ